MKFLPNKPNLEFLKREARKIKSLHRSGDTSVCQSIGHFDTSLHGLNEQQILDTRFSILDAQRVVARQYGFASWKRLLGFVALSELGKNPSDITLKKMIHSRHEELFALQNDMKNKTGDYKTKHKQYRDLSLDSAVFLNTAFDLHGWPGPDVVGPDCMEAIWFVSANAVYDAQFQKRTIDMVSDALPAGGFLEYHYASLKDRYLTLSKQPTIYGISYGCYFDSAGKFQLLQTSVVDPVNLDKRRATAGYLSQAAEYRQFAQEAKENNWDLVSRQQNIDELNRLSVDGGYLSQ